jgi:hypothetical protein
MRLLDCVKNIIIESYGPRKFVDKFNYDDQDIMLFASYHQWEERLGSKTFEELLDIREKMGNKIRVGVPNYLIKNIFKKNFEKISKMFNDIEHDFHEKSPNRNPRLLLIKDRQEQNELENNPEIFDFIEFVVQKNNNDKFEIITSAFSENGNFLKKFNKVEDRTPKLTVESKFYIDKILILNN